MRGITKRIPENIFCYSSIDWQHGGNSQEIFHWFSWLMEVNLKPGGIQDAGFLEEGGHNQIGKCLVKPYIHQLAALITQLRVAHGTHSYQRLSKYWAHVCFSKVFKGKKEKKKKEEKG